MIDGFGHGGPVSWSVRSPDLYLLHFFVWEHMKTKVYHTLVVSAKDLVSRFIIVAHELREIPHVFEMDKQSMIMR